MVLLQILTILIQYLIFRSLFVNY